MRTIVNNKKVPFLVFFQSCLVAFFIDTACINCIIGSFGFGENGGVMALLYIVATILIFTTGFLSMSGKEFRPLNKSLFNTLLYITLLYLVTIAIGGKPYVSLPNFLIFTIVALVIPFVTTIDTKTTLKAIMIYPSIGITRLSKIFVFISDWNEWISMGLSYAFLVPIVATIVYLFLYYKEENIRGKLISLFLTAINLVYFYMIFQYGSRGPILIIVVLILFLLTFHTQKHAIGVRENRKLYVVWGVAIIFIFFLSNPFYEWLDSVLNSYGISSHAISKVNTLSSEGDVSNGRKNITLIAIQEILKRPILGHGLDCFFQNTGDVYPHNFLLQILYDGGILFFAIIIIPLYKGIKRNIRTIFFSEYGMFVLLLFLGVFGAWFSGDLWQLPCLWMFFGMMFKQKGFIYNE